MGLLSSLFGKSKKSDSFVNLPGPGTYLIEVVGESKYQSTLAKFCGGKTKDGHRFVVPAILIHEDKNPYDNKAISVFIQGETVGYLSRENAREYRERLEDAGYPGDDATCSAMIVGGWDRGGDDTGHFGVRLDLPTGETDDTDD
jgi:hypothetical protein